MRGAIKYLQTSVFVHFIVYDYFNIPACLHIYFVLTNIAESFQSFFFGERKRHRSNIFCVTSVSIERFFDIEFKPNVELFFLFFCIFSSNFNLKICNKNEKKFNIGYAIKKKITLEISSYLNIAWKIILSIIYMYTLGRGGKG